MSETHAQNAPVVVIGAGPIGLAAAANLRDRGLDFVVLEAGDSAGAAVSEWAHIRLFSSWSELVDPVAERLLNAAGWQAPNPLRYPTGGGWVASYLEPLAAALGDEIRFRSRVTGVAKTDRDLVVDSGRETATFTVHVSTPEGDERILARAVVDASGTWTSPNPLGADGLPAVSEAAYAGRISYRVPDLTEPSARARYARKHVAVAGTGASAKTALIALARLSEVEPTTRVSWLVRRSSTGNAFGGGAGDELLERGALGDHARDAVAKASTKTFTGFRTTKLAESPDGMLTIESSDGQVVDDVDEIVVVTGFRPDLSMLTEVRLDLDSILQAPRDLAPLIDPNVHSCGTVYPHGAKDLGQPDAGFYVVGMKSYGRATSFLAMTGFEQARSVVAEIAGDHEAAARVELTLPDSGVCGGAGDFDAPEASVGGCCSSPAARGPELITLGMRP